MKDEKMVEVYYEENEILPIVRVIGNITEGRNSLEILLSMMMSIQLMARRSKFYLMEKNFEKPIKGKIVVAYNLIFPNKRDKEFFLRRIEKMFP